MTDDVGSRRCRGQDADAARILIEPRKLLAKPVPDAGLGTFGKSWLTSSWLVDAMPGDDDDRAPGRIGRRRSRQAVQLGDDRRCERGLDAELGEEFELSLHGAYDPRRRWHGVFVGAFDPLFLIDGEEEEIGTADVGPDSVGGTAGQVRLRLLNRQLDRPVHLVEREHQLVLLVFRLPFAVERIRPPLFTRKALCDCAHLQGGESGPEVIEVAGVGAAIAIVGFDELPVGGRLPALGDIREAFEGKPPPGLGVSGGQA